MNDRPTFTSLDQAMESFKLNLDNRPFVRDLLAPFPIDEIVQTIGYLKVVRTDARRALLVHPGYTMGFQNKEELAHMGDRGKVWPDEQGWGIDHPVHGHSGGGQRRPKTIQSTEVCPHCFMIKSLAGTCLCND